MTVHENHKTDNACATRQDSSATIGRRAMIRTIGLGLALGSTGGGWAGWPWSTDDLTWMPAWRVRELIAAKVMRALAGADARDFVCRREPAPITMDSGPLQGIQPPI